MSVEQGFHNQRLTVVPRHTVKNALSHAITRRLIVTDAGYYPQAAGHAMNRPHGAEESILAVCVTGLGWAQIGDAQFRIGSNTVLVIPRNTPHAYGAVAATPWTIWWCHLRGSALDELITAMGVDSAHPIVPLRHADRAVAMLGEIVNVLERDHSPASLIGAAGAAWKLLTQIVVDRSMPSPGDPLDRAMDYLKERFDTTVRVSELAALLGVSPSHLTSLFRRATGGGVIAHQTKLRMARARQLLDITNATVAEVSRQVGYQDQFYFSRHFKKLHEASPTEYRNRVKG